jgi:hypothetical protein
MDLENGKVLEAIEQAKSHCRLQEEISNYDSISLRGVLYTLGYVENEVNQIIQYVAGRGFLAIGRVIGGRINSAQDWSVCRCWMRYAQN